MIISTRQNRLLQVARRKLGISEETWRLALVRIAGVTSATELDREGFEALMGWLEYCGFRPSGEGAPNYGNRPGMATFAQLELIRELWRELHHARECDDAALLGCLRKWFKVDSMRFLTLENARKAITAVETWKARERAEAA